MARQSARGARWEKARKRALKGATVCHICGGEIDFDAPPRSPRSPSVDHIVPLNAVRDADPRTRRQLETDPANLRPAHYGCNSRRGTGRKPSAPRRTSRAW